MGGQNFLEKHVLSLGRLQAVTVGEKFATLAWSLRLGLRSMNKYKPISTHEQGIGLRAENSGIST